MNFKDRVDDKIATHGQFLMAVFSEPDEGKPAFIYTIGNSELGLPELLQIGNFRPEDTGQILNILGERMRDQGCPPEGDISVGGRFPVRCRWAGPEAKREYTIQAGNWLGHEEYGVVQIIFCDYEGRFPGDPGFDPKFEVPQP